MPSETSIPSSNNQAPAVASRLNPAPCATSAIAMTQGLDSCANDDDANTVEILAYSVPEFCAAVGIGRTLAYAEIAAGRLRCKKVGRRTIIPADEVQRWLDAE